MRLTRRLFALALAASFLMAAPLWAEEYSALSPEPTPIETQILEFINRLRANPQADATRILAAKVIPPGVDQAMFKREMDALKTAPPLVFNLSLLRSARNHSWYMVHNGLTHTETPGKKGFTGQSFSDRMKLAGYKGRRGGENAFAQAPGAWFSHCGFTVDWGKGGPGGMQPGRGHRTNMMNPAFREIGCSAVPHSGRFLSVTHNLGDRKSVKRFAGGVVYIDLNANGFYDVGEGRGGITVCTKDGKSSTTTWASGAYTLELPSQGEVTLVAATKDDQYKQSFPAGATNIKFDWAMPRDVDLKKADKLLAAVKKIPDTEIAATRRKTALIALYLETRGLHLDEKRQAEITSLTANVAKEVDAARTAVKEALAAGDKTAARKTVSEAEKLLRGTPAKDWIKDMKTLYAYAADVKAMEERRAADKRVSKKSRDKLAAKIEKKLEKLKSDAGKQFAQTLIKRVQALGK